MANIRSQIKRNRQNVKRRARNRSILSELKTHSKAALAAAQAGDAEGAQEALRLAQKRIDMAAARRVMHPRTAARRKSKLVRQVNALIER